jgi:hypothetical protein
MVKKINQTVTHQKKTPTKDKKMKVVLIILPLVLLCTACIQKPEKHATMGLFSCGPENFATILLKSSLCHEVEKYNSFFLQFNDSLKTKDLPIELRELTCINESEQQVGLTLFETKPDFVDNDLLNFWILVNYEDDIGFHIDTANMRDSINKVLAISDGHKIELYKNVSQNPEADSIARLAMLITLNLRTNQNHEISLDDYNKLIGYMSIVAQLSVNRAEELSLKLWGKSYNNLEMRQKIAVCRLIGFLLTVNISSF